jgi:MFS family permease
MTGLFWVSQYTYVPVLPAYAVALGASYAMVGLVVGSYGLTQMLLRIPIGVTSDQLRKRRVFVCGGIALSVVSSLGMWLFPGVGALLFFRALSGVAAATWVIFTVLFASYFAGNATAKAMGIINSVTFTGQMAGMVLGGSIAYIYGPEATFVAAALIAGAALLLCTGVKETAQSGPTLTIADFFTLAKDRGLLLVAFLGVLLQFVTYGTVFGFTPLAAKAIGANDFEIGVLTMLSSLPGIFGAALMGTVLVPRFGEKAILVSSFLLMALSCVAVPYISDIYILYAVQLVGGFGRGMALPLLMGLSIAKVGSSQRASAMGFFQAAYGIGMTVGPVAAGASSQLLGLEYGFWVMGLMAVAASLLVHRRIGLVLAAGAAAAR